MFKLFSSWICTSRQLQGPSGQITVSPHQVEMQGINTPVKAGLLVYAEHKSKHTPAKTVNN